jgi:outer membrane protein OmpA-like peptidoglycan-associated protein
MLITSRFLVAFLLIYGWTLNAQDVQKQNLKDTGSLITANRQQTTKVSPAAMSKPTGTQFKKSEQSQSDSSGAAQSDALNNIFAMQLALLQSHSVVPRYPMLAHQYYYRNGLGSHAASSGFSLTSTAEIRRESIATTPKTAEAAEEIFANGIYFESGTAKLLDKSKPQLDKIYKFLKEHPDKRLSLVAMQETGTRTNTLMYVRARSVQNYLVRMGLDPDRVRVKKEAFND